MTAHQPSQTAHSISFSRFNRSLLASCAIVALLAQPLPAVAQTSGGNGGTGEGGYINGGGGGSGGTPSTAATNGGPGVEGGGGGGGGAAGGGTGGNGGQSNGDTGIGTGGAAETAGNAGTTGGGGGGGGGNHGFSGTTLDSNAHAGGTGGDGGKGGTINYFHDFGAGGGGGGAGGYGAVVTGFSSTSPGGNITGGRGGNGGAGGDGDPSNAVGGNGGAGGGGGIGLQLQDGPNVTIGAFTIKGGNGGIGGSGGASYSGGNSSSGPGGAGGAGVYFSNSGALNNSGTIQGGNGGAGGGAGTDINAGTNGNGGDGVVGESLSITNSGTIAGGTAGGAGASAGNAINFTGGVNSLTLQTGSTITGNIAIGSGTLIFTQASGSFVVSNTITGNGGIAKTGAGTINLSGTNTYTGGTVVAGGILSINTAAALSSGGVQIDGGTLQENNSIISLSNAITITGNGGTFDVAGPNELDLGTIGDAAGPSGTVVFTNSSSGTGTIVLNGANSYGGATTVGDGTHTVVLKGGTAANTFDASSIYTLNANATLDLNGFDETIGGLAGAAGSAVSLGSNTLTFGDSTNHVVASTISGSGGNLVKVGSGTAALTVANSYNGNTTISAGILGIANNAALGGSTAVLDGGTLQISANNLTVANAIAINTTNGTIDTNGQSATLSGVIADGNGAGALTITDSSTNHNGVVVLSGTNTYSGGTTISGGATVQLGSGQPFGPGASTTVTIDNGTIQPGALAGGIPNAIIINAGGATFDEDGRVGGMILSRTVTGGTGSGTVTFTNSVGGNSGITLDAANSYTGATHVGDGTHAMILLAADTNLFAPASAFTVNANAILDLNANSQTIGSLAGAGKVEASAGGSFADTLTTGGDNSSTTFSGVIGSTGGTLSLVKTGTGVMTLSGANTYTGGTTISAGAINVTNASALGTGAITFDGGGLQAGADVTLSNAITVNSGQAMTVDENGHAFALTGAIGGAGGLHVGNSTGGGSLTLSANSTYAGATIIDSGATLQIGTGSTTGSLGSGAVTDNGALLYDLSSAATLPAISGSGGVSNIGSGTLTISTAETYTGATTASAGTIVIGNGSTAGSVAGAIVDNATISFNRSDSLTYSGVISGTGTLNQAGSGTLILNGVSTFTGTTNVNAGILEVGDGSNTGAKLGGPVNVASGGALEGHGSIGGGVIVASGGTIKPGGSIGTLTVGGNVTLAPGTTFNEEFSNSAASKLAAGGTVQLGGVLQLVSDSTTYTSGTDYTFITGGSVKGTFSSISGTITGYTTTVNYSATGVDLVIATPSVVTPPPVTPVTVTYAFASFGKTVNQIAAGTALAAAAPTSTLYKTAGPLVAAGGIAGQNTLSQLAGDIYASARDAVIEDSRLIRDAVLAHQGVGNGVRIWLNGFGGYGGIASDGNAAALHHTSGGVVGGVDIPITEDLYAGVGGAYQDNEASTTGHSSHAGEHSPHVLAYAGYDNGKLDLRLGGDYGNGTLATTRTLSAFGQTDVSRRGQSLGQIFGEAGWRFGGQGSVNVEPYVGVAHLMAHDNGFAETGGNTALSGAAVSSNLTYGLLGVRASLPVLDMGSFTLMPRIDLAWNHAFNRFVPAQTLSFQNGGTSFDVLGAPVDRDSANVQLGVGMAVGNAVLSLSYDGRFSSGSDSQGIYGGLSWKF